MFVRPSSLPTLDSVYFSLWLARGSAEPEPTGASDEIPSTAGGFHERKARHHEYAKHYRNNEGPRRSLRRHCKKRRRRRSFACNPGKIGGRERFRSTVRAALFQDLSHRLPDTSQSAGRGRCGSTMLSARLHESETISRRLNFFDMGNSD